MAILNRVNVHSDGALEFHTSEGTILHPAEHMLTSESNTFELALANHILTLHNAIDEFKAKYASDSSSAEAKVAESSFQEQVRPWLLNCFGEEAANNVIERNHRFLEEALELVQSCGCRVADAHKLVDYVYGRPVGMKYQEVGGVMVTLAALCLAQNMDMHKCGDIELSRICTKVDEIRAKQAQKPKFQQVINRRHTLGLDHFIDIRAECSDTENTPLSKEIDGNFADPILSEIVDGIMLSADDRGLLEFIRRHPSIQVLDIYLDGNHVVHLVR